MNSIYTPKRLVEIDLVNLAARDVSAFVTWCDESYNERINLAAAAIVCGCFKLVMLTGPSACGKTTSAVKIAARLRSIGTPAKVISLDNFYHNIDNYPRLPDGSKDYENITALDIEAVVGCFKDIIEKGETQLPSFDFLTEMRRADTEHISSDGGVIIIEGIHALNPILTKNFSHKDIFKIYISMREEYSYFGKRLVPSIDLRLARRMVRDFLFRGHTAEKTFTMWTKVCEGEDFYIKVYKREADYLLDTSHSYEACVLGPYLEKLAQCKTGNDGYDKMLFELSQRFLQFTAIDKQYISEDSMMREFVGD